MRRFAHAYEDIISLENLLEAWREFQRGKRGRADVQEFGRDFMDHTLALQRELADGTYRHAGYAAFRIADPKPRDIHKATVRDRLLHHAVYRQLYPFFDRRFIADSFSCREKKGTHRARARFQRFARSASRNDTRTCWVLKCDIRKFFASINHAVLIGLLRAAIADNATLLLLERIIGSFSSGLSGKGLPLGNLTSQLLVNVYMNEFDQFAKHELKVKRYLRYADDFAFLSADRTELERLLPRVEAFLAERLKLSLHPDKVSIGTLAAGVDFLGWVHFPDHRVLRNATRRRMFRRVEARAGEEATVASYRGMLAHGNARKLAARLETEALRAKVGG